MERVDGELGFGQALGDGVGHPARTVGGDHPDALAPLVGELPDEGFEPRLAVAPRAPGRAAPVVVDDHGHALVTLLVARLADADAPEALEPGAARLLVRLVGDAPADAARRVPVDAHGLGDRAPAAVAGEPGRLALEAAGEPAGGRAGPRHRLGPHPVPRALDAPRRALHVAPALTEVERAPPAGREPVVAVAGPAARGAARRAPPRPRGDDCGVPLDSGGLDHGPGESEAVLQHAPPHAGASLGRLSFLVETQSLSERGPRCYRHAFTGRSAHTNPRRANKRVPKKPGQPYNQTRPMFSRIT